MEDKPKQFYKDINERLEDISMRWMKKENEALYDQFVDNLEETGDLEISEEEFKKIILDFQSSVKDGMSSNRVLRRFAELFKIEQFRLMLTNKNLIADFIDNMNIEGDFSEQQLEKTLQNLRALGNLCFENDEARIIVFSWNGIQKMNTLVEQLVKLNCEGKVKKDLVRAVCGCAVNLIGDDAIGIQQLQTAPTLLISIGQLLLDFVEEDSSLTINYCILLENLFPDSISNAETNLGDIQFDAMQIVQMMQRIEPYSESFSDLVHILRLLFTQKPMCSLNSNNISTFIRTLIDIFETNEVDNEAEFELYQLWHILLTHTETMNLLYEDKLLYNKSIEWFNKFHTIEHRLYSVLFFGCFAATRANSKEIVANQHHLLLIDLLGSLNCEHSDRSKNEAEMQECIEKQNQLQRACLGALCNLAIPAGNASEIFKTSKILDHLLDLVKIAETSLAEELLELIRVLLAGGSTIYPKVFTMNQQFMDKCKHWENNRLFPVLRFQVQRLTAIILQVTGCVCKSPEEHQAILLTRTQLLLSSRLVSDRSRALNALQATANCILNDLDYHSKCDAVGLLFAVANALLEWSSGYHLMETFDQTVLILKTFAESNAILGRLSDEQRKQMNDILHKVVEQSNHVILDKRQQLQALAKRFNQAPANEPSVNKT